MLELGFAAWFCASLVQAGTALNPTNRVRLEGTSFRDDSGPFLALGASYFQALHHAKYDRPRLESNLALLATNGFNYVRVLGMVSWEGLEMAPVAFTNRAGRAVAAWPDYWRQFDDLLESAGRHGLRVELTVFADAQYVVPGRAERLAHLDAVLAHLAGREGLVLCVEVANEAWQNGFPGTQGVADLRAFARYLADRTSVPVAISSPPDTSDQGIIELYRDSAADLATVHFSRDTRTAEGGWLPVRDCFRAAHLPGVPPVCSNEPIGPGASVAAESDPVKLCAAAAFAYLANLPAYVFHSRAGIYGYSQCCPPGGVALRFEDTPGISAFRFLGQLLPPDLAGWQRHDGLEAAAPFTVFCAGQTNRYWTEVPGATDGCHRNIGAVNGADWVGLATGILKDGLTLQARRAVRFTVFNPLTGQEVNRFVMKAGGRCRLLPGPGVYLFKGRFEDVPSTVRDTVK